MSPPPDIAIHVVAAADAHDTLTALLGGREIIREPGGKPYVDGGPHFNLSHSGALAMIAVSASTPVGVDLERPARRSRADLVRRVCSTAEQAHVAAAADPDAAFIRLWVRKEAVLKASGEGLRGSLDRLAALDVLGAIAEGFRVDDLPSPAPGYVAALAHRQ